MTKKLYCYIDETGQDTMGALFIVSVVVADEKREQAIETCEAIEQTTGKGRRKWNKTRYGSRLTYIERILQEPIFQGGLNFVVYRDTKEYVDCTVGAIALVLQGFARGSYKATVLIDGLQRAQRRPVGRELHRLGVQTRKVRGVRNEESDALIRLADALCGFVRAAVEGQKEMERLFEWGKGKGYLKELVERKNPLG